MLVLLLAPVDRCSQLCREFEDCIREYSRKSKPGLRDWTKLELKRGDVNEFMDTLAGYKSTIAIGLGIIIMSVICSIKIGPN